MKNGSIDDKLKMQEQELQEPKQYFTDEKKKEVLQSSEKENIISCNLDSKQENKHAYNQPNNNGGDSLLSIFHWEMAIIMTRHWRKNYRHRNAKRRKG